MATSLSQCPTARVPSVYMPSKNVTFTGSTGETLAATIDLPDGQPRAWALFAHCFTCNRKVPGAARTCRALAKQGIACLRFDFTGLGESGGSFADTTFLTNVDDLVAAYEFLAAEYTAPSLLIGHSLGGAAAILAGQRMPLVKAVATIGAPFDPAHSIFHFADAIGDIDAHGTQTLSIAGRDIPISREFLETLADIDPETYIHKLRRPLLLLHSPTDQTVGIDSAQKIFLVARYPKSLMSLDKADHLLVKKGAPQRAADLIRTWAEPYLPAAADA